jgi:hypothetical protein
VLSLPRSSASQGWVPSFPQGSLGVPYNVEDQVPRRRIAFANLAHRNVRSLTLPPLSSNFHSQIVDADIYKDAPSGRSVLMHEPLSL